MNTHIAFTLCSNNYLAEAKALGDSLLKYNPSFKFVIGLVDKKSTGIDYSVYSNFEIIEISEIGIDGLDKMVLQYNIVELNTSVKPFVFKYLFKQSNYSNNCIFYFDPDIVIYHELGVLVRGLDTKCSILTPHILSPIQLDDQYPNEQLFLTYGIYNLGFLGLKWSDSTKALLAWWSERLRKLCYADLPNGLYVDQLWMNLAPLLFNDANILRHPGANVAFWNLHERKFTEVNGRWIINEENPLLFFHFSAFVIKNDNLISKYSTRYTLQNRSELRPLMDDYRSRLKKNNIELLKTIKCIYVEKRELFLKGEIAKYYRRKPHMWLFSMMKPLVPLSVKKALTGR